MLLTCEDLLLVRNHNQGATCFPGQELTERGTVDGQGLEHLEGN